MSTRVTTASATSERWVPLIPALPFTGDGKYIVPYLNGRDIAAVQRVCTTWNRHYLLSEGKREDAHCIREGYPERMVKALRAKGFSLWRLPQVSMTGHENFNLSIWFWPKSLANCAIVRFKTDSGCVGLALRIEGHGEGKLTQHNRLVRAIDGYDVDLSLYHRKEYGYWTFDRGRGDDVENAYESLHKPQHTPFPPEGAPKVLPYVCPTCPSFRWGNTEGMVEFVEHMIANNDPVFHLRRPIQMVDKPEPLPKYVPEAEASFCSSLTAWVSGVCSYVWERLILPIYEWLRSLW